MCTEQKAAEEAIEELKTKGYDAKDISIVMKDSDAGSELSEDTDTKVAGSAVTGATGGAVIGGLAGLLASIALPGIGAFLIGGPIAAALGLTGTAASVASGAATGAMAGGILGALTGLGLSEDEAKAYEERINEGGILVAVPLSDNNDPSVKDILTQHGAEDVKSFSV